MTNRKRFSLTDFLGNTRGIFRSAFPWEEQLSSSDCGPTCLYLILKSNKFEISKRTILDQFQLDKLGTSFNEISRVAQEFNFDTYEVDLDFKTIWEASGKVPFIALINGDHFVVVYEINDKWVCISDPAKGKYKLPHQEFIKIWYSEVEVGHALLMQPAEGEYNKDHHRDESKQESLLEKLYSLVKPFSGNLKHIFIGLFFSSLIQLALPVLNQSIVDIGISTHDINFIYLILGAQIFLFIGRNIVEILRRRFILHMSVNVNFELISSFLFKLSKLPLSYFSKTTTGDIMQRVQDHNRVETLLSSYTLNTVFSLFTVFTFSGLLLYYNTTVFLIFFSSSFLYAIYVMAFFKRRREFDKRAFEEYGKEQNKLLQIIHGIADIKLNNAEYKKRAEWQLIQGKLFGIKSDKNNLNQLQESGSLFINELRSIIITFYVATAVINGSLTLGMMLSIQYILGSLNGPLNQLILVIQEFQDAKLSLERINEVNSHADEDSNISFHNGLDESHLLNGANDINLDNLKFSYSPNFPNILDGITANIKADQFTAIVGTSGSGKTTLLKLLLKFHEPTDGQILISKTDLKFMRTARWRKNCGTVMQEGFIFNDTIANNIALGVMEKDINLEQLIHAAKIANIFDFITQLPHGFNTKVGNEGIGLSTGQKQRLLIARAVYKQPSYLFFDEATSALDTMNESLIVENLKQEFSGKTVIVIAHRLSTIKNADQIIVMDKGKIVESGTHAELIDLNGKYYELVQKQLDNAIVMS